MLAIASMPAVALEVYQWTDENGVVHFSQVAPENDIASVKTHEILGQEELGSEPAANEEDDPYGFKAHREEMDALWAEREERRKAARESEPPQPTTQVIVVREEPVYPYVYPAYGYRPPYRPGRPPLRPRPPIAKPVPYKRP